MAVVELHRTRERQHLVDKLRIERLEEDVDRNEYIILDSAARMEKLTTRATALAISFTGASALLLINLFVSLRTGH